MRTMNGGYAMINLASATIHADALAALASNKPIVVYEATGAPYYADSVTTSGTNIIITKGGKTITIANDNTITNVGDIQLHKYKIEITTNNNIFYVITCLNDLPFAINTKLPISTEIFEYLNSHEIFYKCISIDENSEYVNILYDTADEENFEIETRYFDDGAITSGNVTITHVTFNQLF